MQEWLSSGIVGGATSWGLVDSTWKVAFYHRGLLLQRVEDGEIFLSLGGVGGVMVLGCRIETVEFAGIGVTAYVLGGASVVNEEVIWIPALNFTDYLSIPIKPASPLH